VPKPTPDDLTDDVKIVQRGGFILVFDASRTDAPLFLRLSAIDAIDVDDHWKSRVCVVVGSQVYDIIASEDLSGPYNDKKAELFAQRLGTMVMEYGGG
jgi:hypothetical protein